MRRFAPLVGIVAVVGLLGTAWPALAGRGTVTLGRETRIQTPSSSVTTCPLEGEPTVTVTSAGSWVAYNDDQNCPLNPEAKLHLTSVQLLPAKGGAPEYVSFPADQPGQYLSGDPALTPDPTHPGSVILATLYEYANGLGLAAFRIDPNLKVTTLPIPTIDPKAPDDDKEFIASDTWKSSRYRGRTYLVWDDIARGTVFRSFYGGQWHPFVKISDLSGTPDVAVAPNGDVAVAYISTGDVIDEVDIAVRVSHDGGQTFDKPVTLFRGSEPGRQDPTCPLRGTIGERQRANPSPRVVYDIHGGLHVVAAIGPLTAIGVTTPGVATGGASTVWEATSTNRGETFSAPRAVHGVQDSSATVEWAPAVARLSRGGVAVEWLQISDLPMTQYDSWMSVLLPGASSFTSPVRVSSGTSNFPPLTEALGNSNCYGIGDYTGLATTSTGAVAVWPTGNDVAAPYFDTDVMLRPINVS